MDEYFSKIELIKHLFPEIKEEEFSPALSGTRSKVFLSENYVIKFNKKNPKILIREADLLKTLSHSLIPKIAWSGTVEDCFAVVENKLTGKNLDLIWKELKVSDKTNIIKQIIEFLFLLRTKISKNIFSVNSGIKASNFLDYIKKDLEQKINEIRIEKTAIPFLEEILLVINDEKIKKHFSEEKNFSLSHGDLIIHNLLSDGKNLTGVVDWEFAIWGDPKYDLFRLFYYKECARAYDDLEKDKTFETDYMDKLWEEIFKSDLVDDVKFFREKYEFIRAFFFIGALHWTVQSKNKETNLIELVNLWKKNGTKQQSA